MINAKEKLKEVREISANVAEYVDSELYRLEEDKDVEWTDFEILTYCIPIIVSELQELGVYIALDESDYLSEWIYSDGIVALRKFLDKENLPLFFKSNIEYIDTIKSIFSNIESEDTDLIKDLLELILTKNIDDAYLIDRINYISDYVYSDVIFRDYINFLIKNVNVTNLNIPELDTEQAIQDYKEFAIRLNDCIVPIWNQSVNSIIKRGIELEKSIIEKMEREYLEEYISSKYTNKYVYFSNNYSTSEIDLTALGKDIRIRLQSVLPYSLNNYLNNKNSYNLIRTAIHYGTMMKLYRIVSSPDIDPNSRETYQSCYDVLKYSIKLSINRDIEILLDNIPKSNIGLLISEYLEELIKTEGDPV